MPKLKKSTIRFIRQLGMDPTELIAHVAQEDDSSSSSEDVVQPRTQVERVYTNGQPVRPHIVSLIDIMNVEEEGVQASGKSRYRPSESTAGAAKRASEVEKKKLAKAAAKAAHDAANNAALERKLAVDAEKARNDEVAEIEDAVALE